MIFTSVVLPLILLTLGTMFFIGEILVKARGVFFILGLGLMTFYFSGTVTNESILIITALYALGLILIILDGNFINDGTLSVVGLFLIILSVTVVAESFVEGTYYVLGVLIGVASSFVFLKFMKRRALWDNLVLRYNLTNEGGYNSISNVYEGLLGKEGVTLNDLRPVGDCLIEGKRYSVISKGHWVPKDSKVRVESVDGTRILIEVIDN